MKFTHGNKAIIEHSQNGKDILVFQKEMHTSLVSFKGIFICEDWKWETQKDHKGRYREAIVFKLVPHEEVTEHTILVYNNFLELREKAIISSKVDYKITKKTHQNIHKRSATIRSYALQRAQGLCENCLKKAPFTTKDKAPFLEVHHIRKLSDGGPDHPNFVAALCPNCHKEAHFGERSELLNTTLLDRIKKIEEELDKQRSSQERVSSLPD